MSMINNIPVAKWINLSPLLIQEGWTRHQEEAAKPPLAERTGWSTMGPVRGNAFRNTSPIRPPRLRRCGGFASFLDGSATPPDTGGELPASHSFTASMTAAIAHKFLNFTFRFWNLRGWRRANPLIHRGRPMVFSLH